MPRTLALLTLLAASLLASCHHARGIGYARDDMPPGRPLVSSASPEGYWIWRDGVGWHVRTTSDAPRQFHGTVEMLGGTPTTVRAVGRAESGVRQDGHIIEFNYVGARGEQGFDWAGSSGCHRFELYIDGDTRPLRVFLGEVEASPARVPFAVCG